MNCLNCNIELRGRQTKYCSQRCKHKHIKLNTTDGLVFILDKLKLHQEVFTLCLTDNNLNLNALSWYIDQTGYVTSQSRLGSVRLHKIIWSFFKGKVPKGYVIDHINRNKLDNRLSNLRLATLSNNASNKGANFNKKNSIYKGVQVTGSNKFQAVIWFNNKNHGLGSFDTAEEAALAYNAAARLYQGEYAYQNIIA